MYNIEQVGTGRRPVGSPEGHLSHRVAACRIRAPAGFAFVTSAAGRGPDILYVADNGNNAVEKFSYNGMTWVLKGSVRRPG